MCIHIVLINSYSNNDDPVSGITKVALLEGRVMR